MSFMRFAQAVFWDWSVCFQGHSWLLAASVPLLGPSIGLLMTWLFPELVREPEAPEPFLIKCQKSHYHCFCCILFVSTEQSCYRVGGYLYSSVNTMGQGCQGHVMLLTLFRVSSSKGILGGK